MRPGSNMKHTQWFGPRGMAYRSYPCAGFAEFLCVLDTGDLSCQVFKSHFGQVLRLTHHCGSFILSGKTLPNVWIPLNRGFTHSQKIVPAKGPYRRILWSVILTAVSIMRFPTVTYSRIWYLKWNTIVAQFPKDLRLLSSLIPVLCVSIV